MLLAIGGLFASHRPTEATVPGADTTQEPADGRRWVPVIRSRCSACQTVDERPGGVLCPQCGAAIPEDAPELDPSVGA